MALPCNFQLEGSEGRILENLTTLMDTPRNLVTVQRSHIIATDQDRQDTAG